MKRKKLIIIGAGGHGKVIADIAFNMKRWENILFIDDTNQEKEILGFPIVGSLKDTKKFIDDADFFIAIGNNNFRSEIIIKLENQGASLATLIHPTAIIGMDVSIGSGTAVMAGVVINSSCSIGRGVILNTGSTIDHDCIVGDFTHISPGVNIAGTVNIGEKTWIGIGSTIRNNIKVGSEVIIGAGSIIVKNINRKGTYFGNPLQKKLEE